MSDHSANGPELSGGDQNAINANRVLALIAGLETIDLLASGEFLYALVGTAAVGLAVWNDKRMQPQSVQHEQ